MRWGVRCRVWVGMEVECWDSAADKAGRRYSTGCLPYGTGVVRISARVLEGGKVVLCWCGV